ncbi:MAG: hypothetical protein J7623_13690 [Chitinophaga sp.]|uniref:hypothetical protein n=1 Tax=Chitinophaga sp. TaxID=1869181 RepID=UPI001B0F19B3|nr:hypothetical protein [Chitinophaga sp.]MBO9729684.1 hypothetical protein [Chitinophaga sp.]
MLHALSHPPRKYISDLGTGLISWGLALFFLAGGYPLLVAVLRQILLFLYEVFIRYQY